MDRSNLRLITSTFAAHTLVHTTILTIPLFVPIWLTEFSVSRYELGLAISTMFALYGLMAIPAGVLSDKYSSDRFIKVFLIGTGASLLALRVVPGYVSLVVVLGAVGATAGLYHAPALSLISRVAESPSRALGYHALAANVGNGVGPLLIAVALTYVGWRGVLPIISVALFVVGAYFVVWGPEDPDRDQAGTQRNERYTGGAKSLFSVLFLVLLALYTFRGIYQRGSISFLPDFFTLVSGLHPIVLAGREIPPERWVYSVILLVSSIGTVGAGFLAERFRTESLLVVTFLSTTGLLWILGDLSGTVLLVVGTVFGILLFASGVLLQDLVANYTISTKRGAGYGVIFAFSHGVGGLGAGLTGWLATIGSYSLAFKVLGVFSLVTVACIVALHRIGRREPASGSQPDAS